MTKSRLVALLKQHHITPRRGLGQNFLIDPNFLRYILRAAQLSKSDYVLEIGSGPGHLTGLIAEKARFLWAVEIDEKMLNLAREILEHIPNIEFIKDDVLTKDKEKLNPVIERRMREKLGEGDRIKVISNLPYARAVPIILALLEANLPWKSMCLTVQWETAQRLLAKPTTNPYTAFTILAQTLADIRLIKKIRPEVFWPKPGVYSALIQVTPKKPVPISKTTYQALKRLLRAVFRYRRKMIITALKRTRLGLNEADLPGLLSASGIASSQRPQEIPPEAYICLTKKVT